MNFADPRRTFSGEPESKLEDFLQAVMGLGGDCLAGR